MSTHCNNCKGILEDSFAFCPYCSQKVKLHRLSLHDIAHEGIHYFTHADKGIFKLLQQLISRSGAVARDYVGGKRKKYFPPLNFFLLVATVLVLVFSFIAPSKPTDSGAQEVVVVKRPASPQRRDAIMIRQGKAISFMNKYSNIIAMIAVPLICVFYRLFYLKGSYNYTEHLVACMYMVGFTNLFYALVFAPMSILFGLTKGPSWVPILIFMLFQIIYNSVFYYKFIGREGFAGVAKSSIASIFAIVFWYVFSGLLVGVYIKNGFGGLLA